MALNEQLPEWNSTGSEPPQEKKDQGWLPSEKPPAGFFNWFFNRTFKVLQEIRNALGAAGGIATLDETGNVPANQLGNVSGMESHGNEYHDVEFETTTGAQAKVDAHAGVTSAHSATSTATANRIMMRDAAGRAKVAAPSAADDIARKDTVDAVNTALTSHMADNTNPHGVTAAQIGAEPAFSKNNAFNKNFGTAAGTVAQGNDSRFLTTTQKGDLTDGGDTSLHYHSGDRAWANITGKPSTFTPSAHTHDAIDVFKNPGDILIAAPLYGSGVSGTNGTPYKVFTIRVGFKGSARVKFAIRVNTTGTAYGRIYVNGVAKGTTRSTTSTTMVYFTEDIAGINPGDQIELYVWLTGSTAAVYYTGFCVGVDSCDRAISDGGYFLLSDVNYP